MTSSPRVNIPRGTKLQDIVWCHDTQSWQVWIALNDRSHAAHSPQREGTFLLLQSNGAVTRVADQNGEYNEFVVRPADPAE